MKTMATSQGFTFRSLMILSIQVLPELTPQFKYQSFPYPTLVILEIILQPHHTVIGTQLNPERQELNP